MMNDSFKSFGGWANQAAVGDRIGCVGAFSEGKAENKPERGACYHVREIHRDENGVFFLLKEIVNTPKKGAFEVDFHSSGFMPLKGACARGHMAYNLERDFTSIVSPPQPYEPEQ